MRLRAVVDLEGLSDRDRVLAWELAQGTERCHLFLDFVVSQFVRRRLPADPRELSVLRLGAYQLLKLSRVPPRAAVHETVGLLRSKRGFANAVLRQVAAHVHPRAADRSKPRRELPLVDGPDGPRCLVFDDDALPPVGSEEYLAVRHGLPEFLVSRWIRAHGREATAAVCEAADRVPAIVLRPTARFGAATEEGQPFSELLAAQGVEAAPLSGGSMFRVVRGAPFGTSAFAAGFFVAQDPTAFAAAEAVAARPGETVLDLCAAPGTKTTVLAEAVGPGGRVVAFDPDVPRRAQIQENITRLGLADRVTVVAELPAERRFDRVLADVPCSNTGVLSRRVEVRRRLRPETFDALATTQSVILSQAFELCRDGGTVVYSTCSIEPEENRGLVDAVLGAAPDCGFRVVSERLTLPSSGVGDGGYYAVLEHKRNP